MRSELSFKNGETYVTVPVSQLDELAKRLGRIDEAAASIEAQEWQRAQDRIDELETANRALNDQVVSLRHQYSASEEAALRQELAEEKQLAETWQHSAESLSAQLSELREGTESITGTASQRIRELEERVESNARSFHSERQRAEVAEEEARQARRRITMMQAGGRYRVASESSDATSEELEQIKNEGRMLGGLLVELRGQYRDQWERLSHTELGARLNSAVSQLQQL